jgi:transcriptional regulator with XRE-family HTH domain
VNSPPISPAAELIVTTRPWRWARITGSTARVTFSGPKRFVSTWARKLLLQGGEEAVPAACGPSRLHLVLADPQITPAHRSRTGPDKRGTHRDPVRGAAGPNLLVMDEKEAARAAVREFLTTRRARVTPADAGLPPQGARRRVKGLRREEVALLAGVSPEYYVRLERGQATGPSAGVVDAVGGVLRLDADERAHLDRLLAALTPEARKRRRVAAKEPVTPGVRILLDSMDHLPAVVFNGRLDMLAVNALGRALYSAVYDPPGRENSARFLFLDEPRARDLFPEWDRIAGDTVAMLRIEAGRHPDDPELIELIGQLSTRSIEFRSRWAANDVRAHRGGTKTFRHPLIGVVTLPFENLHVDAVSGQVLTVFTPRPGSPEADAIRLLASWNAKNEQQMDQTAGTSGRMPDA